MSRLLLATLIGAAVFLGALGLAVVASRAFGIVADALDDDD